MNPGFARYMESCLYDAETGYYGSGSVEFGSDPHFWTYPRMLSPIFGWALAERVRDNLEIWTELGLLTEHDNLTIIEVGGGDGCLARDVLDYMVEHSNESTWQPYVGRLRYVLGDLSPALRARQESLVSEHIAAGRARVVEMDAGKLCWEEPFKGIVICNELIDAFPCEILRVEDPDLSVSRVHLVRSAAGGMSGPGISLKPVPLAAGWWSDDGEKREPPTVLLEYLRALHPLLRDLDSRGMMPTEIYWPPSLPHFVEGLGRLFNAAGNLGGAFLIDYGGTSRHVLDPGSLAPHLRTYGSARRLAHTADVFGEPGRRDITCDVDFTELARLGRENGLEVGRYVHQSGIESARLSFDDPEALDALATRLSRDVGYAPGVAGMVAPRLVRRFRRSPCYWCLTLSAPGIPTWREEDRMNLRPDGEALETLSATVRVRDLEQALLQEALPSEIAGVIKPCGDIAADLSDHKWFQYYRQVLAVLEGHG